VHYINTTEFYLKYIYEPALKKPRFADVPKKSQMEVDTNPLANWFIIFINHREANEK